MANEKSSAHRITIRGNDAGTYDVLTNGCSYRIHRGLAGPYEARLCAQEIQRAFRRNGERASIEHDGCPAQYTDSGADK